MAEVYKAKAVGIAGFEKILALKRIKPRYAKEPRFIRNFIDDQGNVQGLAFASYGTRWWILGDRRHVFAEVGQYQRDTVEGFLHNYDRRAAPAVPASAWRSPGTEPGLPAAAR